jgi:hypothetical protein
MAANPKFSNLTVNGEADFIGVAADSGYLRIYDGTQPATADTAIGAQVLLAELRFAADAFPAAVAGLLTANAIASDASADATGTASWARILKSDGTSVLFDGSVGTSSANVIVATTSIVAATVVSCSSLTLQVSKG